MRAPASCLPSLWLIGAALGGAASAQELTASEAWYRLRDAYAQLATFRGEGELVMDDVGTGAMRFAISTRLEAGVVHFEARPVEGEPVSLVAESRRAGRSSSAGWRRELDRAVGAGAAEGLPELALLVEGPAGLAEPEALALEGREACGEETCLLLQGTSPGGAAWKLWLGERDFRVRASEVELRRAGAVRVFRATLRPLPVEVPAPLEQVYAETIDVSLSSLVVRVRDARGQAVADLAAGDFRLRLGEAEVSVEAAEWVGAPPSLAAEGEPVLDAAPAPGRLILFFVQADFHPSRLAGQLQMRQPARRFLDGLRPQDRVAVVSFDSHLKLRADFTGDRERLGEALDAGLRTGPEPLLRPGPEPSLARHFDRGAARRAATPERGLEVAARALVPIDGEKTVVFVGWGLGRLTEGGVTMLPEYYDALRALEAARATVFALDVTHADYHSLEAGLKQVARDTGGTYQKTHEFTGLAMARLEAALAGHYVLYFRLPEDAARPERLRVELRDPRRGSVLQPEGVLR